MDNASYYTVTANKASSMLRVKVKMQNWIISICLSYLWVFNYPEFIFIQKEPTVYKTDLIWDGLMVTKWSGFRLVSVNPNELIKSIEKNNRWKKCRGFSQHNIDIWNKECDHVKKVEDKYNHTGISVGLAWRGGTDKKRIVSYGCLNYYWDSQ